MAQEKKQVEVRLFPDGNMRVEAHNIKGKQCLKYIELFESLLQAQVIDSAFTDDYYQSETVLQTSEETEVLV